MHPPLTRPPKSGPRPADPVLDDGGCTLAIMESESNAAPGHTFSDIDPIPIPGPPGSFLPSPGHAETEDYQGNSSLTASLISSHEQEDIISLDSPNSAASSVSNLAAEMSEKVAEKSASTGNHAIATSSLLSFPIPTSEVSMEKVLVIPRAMKVGAPCSEFGVQKSFVKPQESIPPCCCSRREKVSRGSVVDDYQESQLLRRRTMSAVILPPKENISCSLNTAPSYSCAASEISALKNGATFSHGLKGTGVSMAAEHAQSRLAYPGLPTVLSSALVYMQQGPRNTCFPLPFSDRSSVNPPQVNISQNGPYVLQGGPYMTAAV